MKRLTHPLTPAGAADYADPTFSSTLITWQQAHPESDCFGVDLSAPCLRIANQRAREHGMSLHLSQQELAHLDYATDSFDLIIRLLRKAASNTRRHTILPPAE